MKIIIHINKLKFDTMKKGFSTKMIMMASILLLGSISIFTACNKSNTTFRDFNNRSLDVALDQSFAAELFDEIVEISDEVMNINLNDLKSGEMNGNRNMRCGSCATVTKETVGESVITTVDFGEEGCTGQDGRLRQGKIIITKTGNYWDGDVIVLHEFENYFVNGNQLTGTKTTTGYINEAGNRQMDIVDNGAIILAEDGGTITWTAQRTREIIEGSDTREKNDDVIQVTGSSAGISATGDNFTCEIVVPLIRKNPQDCSRFYVSGMTEIVKGDGTEITINYGDGTCDNLAEVTTNGETEIVELQGHRRRMHM